MRYPWLWRFWLKIPARGQMVAYDTSWYRRVLADRIAKTVQALESNGFQTFVVETGEEARDCVLGMIPSGVEVYNSASRTLELIGLAADIQISTRFQPLRARLKDKPLSVSP